MSFDLHQNAFAPLDVHCTSPSLIIATGVLSHILDSKLRNLTFYHTEQDTTMLVCGPLSTGVHQNKSKYTKYYLSRSDGIGVGKSGLGGLPQLGPTQTDGAAEGSSVGKSGLGGGPGRVGFAVGLFVGSFDGASVGSMGLVGRRKGVGGMDG
mmetsp:Transcript_37151/g.54336  ORF Transcript_37151/g.54336 Transcript_37151/m.54336 type:complete len:152 (+) Transcript_37151:234-689(+)